MTSEFLSWMSFLEKEGFDERRIRRIERLVGVVEDFGEEGRKVELSDIRDFFSAVISLFECLYDLSIFCGKRKRLKEKYFNFYRFLFGLIRRKLKKFESGIEGAMKLKVLNLKLAGIFARILPFLRRMIELMNLDGLDLDERGGLESKVESLEREVFLEVRKFFDDMKRIVFLRFESAKKDKSLGADVLFFGGRLDDWKRKCERFFEEFDFEESRDVRIFFVKAEEVLFGMEFVSRFLPAGDEYKVRFRKSFNLQNFMKLHDLESSLRDIGVDSRKSFFDERLKVVKDLGVSAKGEVLLI